MPFRFVSTVFLYLLLVAQRSCGECCCPYLTREVITRMVSFSGDIDSTDIRLSRTQNAHQLSK